MTSLNVRFTPDSVELGRIQAAFSDTRPRLPIGYAIALAALLVLQGVLGLSSRHVFSHWFAYVQIVFGACYLPLSWGVQNATHLKATAADEINVTIDDAGITLAHPAMRIPWKRIVEIRDVGEAFVAVRMYEKAIPIFKRALADDGSALWAALDAKLTATRYLVRGTDSPLRIVNSAARH